MKVKTNYNFRNALLFCLLFAMGTASADSLVMAIENLREYTSDSDKYLETETAESREEFLGRRVLLEFFSDGSVLRLSFRGSNDKPLTCERQENGFLKKEYVCPRGRDDLSETISLDTAGEYIRSGRFTSIDRNRTHKSVVELVRE